MTRLLPRLLASVAVLVALAGQGALPASAAAAPSAAADDGRLVVVGAPGLAWSDLEDADVPNLRALADEGAGASLTVRAVRSRSCAVDGWLTLSAGRRAADVAGPCRVPAPVGADGAVPLWDQYLAAASAASYGARPGTLGTAVDGAGACVEAVGPGAAVGAADRAGSVPHWSAELPDAFSCAVVLVDGGTLPDQQPERGQAVGRLDAVVEAVRRLDPAADVLVVGMGDGDSSVRPRALLAAGPGFGPGTLTSSSTRQPATVQLQDVTATVLARVGVGDQALTGRPLVVEPSTDDAATRLSDRVGFETRAATLREVSPQVTGWLAAAFALWCAVVAVLWWRDGTDRPLPQAVRVSGVALAAFPVGTFLANLVPWWTEVAPGAVFAGALLVAVAVVTVVALAVERRRPLGALLTVAVVTLLVLGGDVLLGSRLQLGSVFGQNPTVGGRFYGFGNTSFALYGLAVLAVVAAVAGSRRIGRWAAAGAALGILVVALAIEALPSLGADFGGPPGLLLGGLLVIALAIRLRLTPVRVIAAVVGAGVLVVGVAVLDWLRPADSRTHLGDFVESVVSGEAGAVVGRKLAQNVANLGSPPLVAMAVATLVVVVVAWRRGWRPSAAGTVVLEGAVVLAVVGFAVNDSGLVIPAFVAVVLAPLLVAAGRAERSGT
ncbi:hypothetical protein [Oryzobacter telluris]|uniref:hypothetical protein n=1 Tax=Oryzobacter telluris TaxID=3149179 RepID=UPI00370D1A36